MPAADLLAIVASTVFLVRLLPQPVRLARSGVAQGVSPVAALAAVVSAAAWTAYGLSAGLFAVWFVSVLALVPSVWQAVLLRRRVAVSDLGWAAAFVTGLVVAAALGAFGAVLAGSVLVTVGPQVHRALAESDLSGIAPATWWVALADAATWGLYGAVIGDAALLGYAVALTAAAVLVLARLAWVGRHPLEPALEPALEPVG